MTFKQVELNPKLANGFSLFEMLVVIIVIGLLIYASFPHYFSTIENSKGRVLEFQAATFARTIENLYGKSRMSGAREVALNGITIYMNERGWPASTSKETSLKSYNQSPKECELLWKGIFQNAPESVIVNTESRTNSNKNADFEIFSINGRICRYELVGKQDERYFFDYDLRTGEVTVHSPQ
ncbi:prepilin-type N-terminal cleavage/methylation domain-containing protein [Alteromonadaceae bacterium 2753L.S.0a.02]|nr:prepilin-type N-terminal cleavage/methylation domain-containing protein [Alteromonadaceae bacterium 2753L.S.0a.02]